MYNVLDICRYVINYSNRKDYGISNLKLQKILYFIQAYFLTYTRSHDPCFYEKIEAWDFGPVVPEAYHEYKQFGGGDIPSIRSYTDFDNARIPMDETIIKRSDRNLINQVVDRFADYTATDLVMITHNQTPWKHAYEYHKNNEISNESIRRYFGE